MSLFIVLLQIMTSRTQERRLERVIKMKNDYFLTEKKASADVGKIDTNNYEFLLIQ